MKRPGVGIMNKWRQWILTATKLYQEKVLQVLWETHMMLVILLVQRAREDDIEDLDEPPAQQRLVEIDGPKREREHAESDEESAKRTRLNSEQSKTLNAPRKCSGRKKNDKIC